MSRKPSANVVDNSLVLSLPNAINPVVWRMELAKAKMSAIEIREDKLRDFTLILKTPKGDSNEIARFNDKSDALKGLGAISSAMSKAEKDEGKSGKPAKSGSFLKKAAIVIASLLGFAFAFIILINVLLMFSGTTVPSTGSTSSGAIIQDGVPQSADDFLKGR